MRRVIAVRYSPAAPGVLGALPGCSLSAVAASSSSINLTATYAGPPSAATYGFYQWDAAHGAWLLLAVQAGTTLAVNGLSASTLYKFMAVVNTAESPSRMTQAGNASATTQASGGSIKWHPGHYMLSFEIDRSASGQIAAKRTEQTAMLASGANVLGWAGRYQWQLLDIGDGADHGGYGLGYDFSHIDADIAACGGKRIIIQVGSGYYGSTQPVPSYILNDSTMGASPVGGQYGYWTLSGATGKTAAIWRANVMARWQALFVALGNYYNGNALVEAISVDDESVQGQNLDGGSDYSWAAQYAQWNLLEIGAVAAMPTTSFIMHINYAQTLQATADMLQTAYANRVAFGGPDVYGQSVSNPFNNGGFYDIWGIDVFQNIPGAGTSPGTDYRGKMANMHAIQSPELNGFWATTPTDIALQCNQIYVSHAFWNYISGTGTGNWTGGANSVLAAINANPLTHTTYPSSYP
jgi:hypothetical protein